MRKSVMIMLFALMLSTAQATDITVKATVKSARIAFGSVVSYTITVNGAQDLQPPALPPIDGLDVRYSGPATHVAVINGVYSVEQSFNYVLIPLKKGSLTIPPVEVDVKGQKFTTEAVAVDVVTAVDETPSVNGGGDKVQDIESRLKVLMAVSKARVYAGEAVPLTIRLYVNQLSLQELSFPEITHDGFRLESFSEPKQFQEAMDGINWQVIEFSTLLYPTRAGGIKISPAVLRGSLLFKAESSKDTSGGLFDDGFFGNFFTSYQKRPVTMTSNAVTLDALPLPEEGKPADFSGAVGEFEFTAEAAPLKVKAGDPVTLRMQLTGVGSMKAVTLPVFKADGFKVYDPQIKDEGARKSLEQVLIPTDVKLSAIPPVKFTYFDVKSGAYRMIERGPFPLQVAPASKGDEFQAVGFSRSAEVSVPETFGRDIVFIKDHPGRLEKRADAPLWQMAFYVILALYLQAWGAFLVIYLRRRRLMNDPRFARQAAAAREARAVFKAAREHLADGNTKGFYEVLENGLRDYFSSRCGLPSGNLDILSVEEVLRAAQLDEKYILRLKDIYKVAEHARFAGMPGGVEGMQSHLADAEDIVRLVERRSR